MTWIDAAFFASAILVTVGMVVHWLLAGRENARKGKEAREWLRNR